MTNRAINNIFIRVRRRISRYFDDWFIMPFRRARLGMTQCGKNVLLGHNVSRHGTGGILIIGDNVNIGHGTHFCFNPIRNCPP